MGEHIQPKIVNLGDVLREAEIQLERERAARTIDAFDRGAERQAQIIADLKAELEAARAEALRVGKDFCATAAELATTRAELEAARSILATWLQWGGHCETCEFVRQRAANPALDTSLFADYCDCGWYLARKAVEGVK